MNRIKNGRATIGGRGQERPPHVNDHIFALVKRGVRNLCRPFSRNSITER